MNDFETPFVFFLCLDESLPKAFYKFNKTFKDLGFTVIPIRIDQLQTLVASTDQQQLLIISSVQDANEYRKHNLGVRQLLKYILKSKRITFFQLSSFSKLNDSGSHALTRNYFFMKYPLDAKVLSERIVEYHESQKVQNVRWPGGKRAGVNSVV